MKNALSLTFLFCFALVFCWPILSGQEFLYFRDTLLHTLSGKWFLKNYFHGLPALWNPHIYMGFPQFAVPTNGNFYPLNFIFACDAITQTYPFYIFTHFLLALGFTFAFVKNLTTHHGAGIFAALAFSFSGFLVFSAGAQSGFVATVWLPTMLYFLERSQRQPRWVMAAAIAAACQMLAGEIHYCAMSLLVALGFCLSTFSIIRGLKTFFILVLTAIGLASLQLVPTLEFLPWSNRAQGLSWQEATVWSFHPRRLLEFITPFPFGNLYPGYTNYTGGQFFPLRFNQPFVLSAYFGMFPALFFLLSANRWLTKKYRLWFGLGLCFLFLSFGAWSPLFKVVHHLPVFSSLRYPEKFIWVTIFCFVMVASQTFATLAQHHRRLGFLILGFCAVELFTFAKQLFFTTRVDLFSLSTPWMDRISNERLLRFTDFKPRFALPDIAEIERDHVIAYLSGKENTQVLRRGRFYTSGYDGTTLRATIESIPSPLTADFLNASGSRWILAGLDDDVPNHLVLRYESKNFNIRLWENPEALPLVYWQTGTTRPISIPYQRPTPDEIIVDIFSGEAGELVLNETNYRGWQVWVDGKRAPLAEKTPIGKSVLLQGSEKHVEFRFRPLSFRLGLAISTATLVLLLVFSLFRRARFIQ